jgi:hypothetical protein
MLTILAYVAQRPCAVHVNSVFYDAEMRYLTERWHEGVQT